MSSLSSPRPQYDGPIIDAHHHFWDLRENNYPWLAPHTLVPHRYGDYSAIKHTYLPADYQRDAAGHDVVASVYVEAEWAPGDAAGETRYVTQLSRASGRPNAMVAQAWLDASDAAEQLATQSEYALVRSVRHKPGPPDARGQTLMSSPIWRQGYSALARNGLHFDLQAPWQQCHEAATLARDFPDTLLIVNHAGVPGARDAATLRGWQDAMATLSRLPNVLVKVSGLCEAGKPWSVAANQPVLDALRALFGADRLMFGSNFPVDGMFLTLNQLIHGFKSLVAGWTAAEQCAFFNDTAARVYRPITLPGIPSTAPVR